MLEFEVSKGYSQMMLHFTSPYSSERKMDPGSGAFDLHRLVFSISNIIMILERLFWTCSLNILFEHLVSISWPIRVRDSFRRFGNSRSREPTVRCHCHGFRPSATAHQPVALHNSFTSSPSKTPHATSTVTTIWFQTMYYFLLKLLDSDSLNKMWLLLQWFQSAGPMCMTFRHRLNRYLAQRVPSLFLARSSRNI